MSSSGNGASAERVVEAHGNGGPPAPPLRLGGMALRNGLLIHGADERAAVADIEFAERFYRDTIRQVLG